MIKNTLITLACFVTVSLTLTLTVGKHIAPATQEVRNDNRNGSTITHHLFADHADEDVKNVLDKIEREKREHLYDGPLVSSRFTN